MLKNILYLCFNYPFPEKTGEEHNFASHILELSQSKYKDNILFLFSNPNDNKSIMPFSINYRIFQNKKIVKCKFARKLIYFLHILISKYPKNISDICTSEMKDFIQDKNAEIIILDSIYSITMLPKNLGNSSLIYIAHNNENKLYKDIVKIEKNIFTKLYKYIYCQKISKVEKEILKKADKIVCISTSDYNYFKNIYPKKVAFLPHKIEIQKQKWDGKNTKTLFFCGPLHFAPNYDSVKWIAEELSPILSNDIKIYIAGKGTDDVPESWRKDNIEYLGFVSREELLDLYKNSSAFLCPIVYGSGVKIKVTEALGFGTPVIATKEALEGLDYINISPLVDRNNMQQTKENIEGLLNNREKLEDYSKNLIKQIESYQENNENSLDKLIGALINE